MLNRFANQKNLKMKKNLILICLALWTNISLAQNGLEDIIVEKFYISNANDTNANSIGGVLPIGSVTYRIYVDMLPGYTFQAAYGLSNQELRIETTTSFFNNMDYGSTSPTFSKANSAKNTVMLDSWLSVGGACNGYMGVLKTDDDGMLTNINTCSGCSNSPILQNNDVEAGIPLTQQDGMLIGSPLTVTSVGISSIIGVFGNSTNGNLFSTIDGSWAALGGASGIDPTTNRVLIAQLTTDGVLTFKLNIQLGSPGGGTERYVAANPVGSDIQSNKLIYDSSILTNFNNLNTTNSVFKIFPNPVKDSFTIEIKSREKSLLLENGISIYSIEGAEVLSKSIDSNSELVMESIDFSKFSKGIYIVKINLNGTIFTKRLVKI